jgi:hypothetical protein
MRRSSVESLRLGGDAQRDLVPGACRYASFIRRSSAWKRAWSCKAVKRKEPFIP